MTGGRGVEMKLRGLVLKLGRKTIGAWRTCIHGQELLVPR